MPRWLRGEKRYLIVRKSLLTFWPHVMLTDSIEGIEVEEFKPLHPIKGWRAMFAAIVFKGRVRVGKGEE
jgi:hypothetical protein